MPFRLADPTLPSAVHRSLAARPVDIADLPDVPRSADGRVDVVTVARAFGGTLLESAPEAPATGRFSYVVAATAGRLVHDGHTAALALDGRTPLDLGRDAFAAIDAVAAAAGCVPDDAPPSGGPALTGGLVGAFGYDLGRLVERLPERAAADRPSAWLDLALATAVVAVDHLDESAVLVTRPLGNGPRLSTPAATRRLRESAALPPPRPTTPPRSRLTTSLPRPAYLAAVRRILGHIAAGDVFQVNLTQRLTGAWAGESAALYAALRAASPAPHAAWHPCRGGDTLVSISPETFLAVRGREVTTRPIKGTRPRHADRTIDEARREELAGSAKDRAENVMVVDLERNDLGRVCVTGSVEVADLLVPEPHPTVWQLVSTIRGRLRDDVGYGTLLRATFPSGSVTGAPKVRAMELIDEIEPVRRGWYCGSVGFLAPGAASLSVAIRTAVLADGRVDYAAGGGIVADSDPAAEHAESLAKAAAFVAAIDGELERPW